MKRGWRRLVHFVSPDLHLLADRKFRAAPRAGMDMPLSCRSKALQLEDRFLAVLKAICTKPMTGLGVLHRCLFDIGKRTRGDFAKLIILTLCRPIGHTNDLLFKLAYAIGARRIFLLREKQRLLGVENKAVQSGLDLDHFARLQRAIDGCYNIYCRLQTGKPSGDLGDHVPPSIRPWSPSRAKD